MVKFWRLGMVNFFSQRNTQLDNDFFLPHLFYLYSSEALELDVYHCRARLLLLLLKIQITQYENRLLMPIMINPFSHSCSFFKPFVTFPATPRQYS